MLIWLQQMSAQSDLHESLQDFAAEVKSKLNQLVGGEPEEQLRTPFDAFIKAVARALGMTVKCIGETNLPDRLGRPDFAITIKQLLAGYVELKPPGTGADTSKFRGHNREQWKRFSAIPNILYTDGNEWGLYRSGELSGKRVRLTGDVEADGKKAVTANDADALARLLHDFLQWEPTLPMSKGKIDVKAFAEMLAPLCRMLRDDVTDALKDAHSPLVQLADEWRKLLFPDATNEQFADAYAQTVAFALLLGRSEGANPLSLDSATKSLAAQHGLLSRALQVLTDEQARNQIQAALDLLVRVIGVVPPASLSAEGDPWLYFYEDFLAVYDPSLRKDAGVYYTPVEVVHAQVRLIDDLLVNRLNKPLGFVDPGVTTLDPAAGAGTYLLGVIEHALGRIKTEQGTGAVAGQASVLAKNLYGFEIMVGPYAVTELRTTRALHDHGAALPADGTHIYLTDTLESPNAKPPQLPLFLRPIAEQHAKALAVKSEVPVIVCLGNPPYDRHEAVDVSEEDRLSRYGGWVRFGDPLPDNDKAPRRSGAPKTVTYSRAALRRREESSVLRDFVNPAMAAGHGVHLKWIYNLYVYFWRWALWKVFEHESATGPGVVSFITAASYLFGDTFVGMREHMRRQCDEIWILDLGGEGRGARRSENVFAIQTPVAIALAMRTGAGNPSKPAKVHYAPVTGSREEKLAKLESITALSSAKWEDCPSDWQAPFLPEGKGSYFSWPQIIDLFPWQHSGCQLFRTWPIAPDETTLTTRWKALLASDDRPVAFRESRDRKVNRTYTPLLENQERARAISKLARSAPPPRVRRYGFRSFDRQYTFADSRFGDVMKPVLWATVLDEDATEQVFITSKLWQVLGAGPALVASSFVPDFHSFKGSYGGKDVIPLFRDSGSTQPNILPGLLDSLFTTYGRPVSAEDFLAYAYGTLAQPAFTSRYSEELLTRQLRVPVTKDPNLFDEVRAIGARLLWLHTYGERFVPEGEQRGRVPPGIAKSAKAIPEDPNDYPETFEYRNETKTLKVGAGEIRPVSREVYGFEVSGLKVVQSWLRYRMKHGAGRKSSPLDDIRPKSWTAQFTNELLELLWVLEATVATYPKQAELLEAVVKGPCLTADELPAVPDEMRKAPKTKVKRPKLFEDDDDEDEG